MEYRLPNNLNMSFALCWKANLFSWASMILPVSSGSACTSATLEPSYVLKALGVGEDLAHTSIRLASAVQYAGRGRLRHRKDDPSRHKLRELSPLYEMARRHRYFKGQMANSISTSPEGKESSMASERNNSDSPVDWRYGDRVSRGLRSLRRQRTSQSCGTALVPATAGSSRVFEAARRGRGVHQGCFAAIDPRDARRGCPTCRCRTRLSAAPASSAFRIWREAKRLALSLTLRFVQWMFLGRAVFLIRCWPLRGSINFAVAPGSSFLSEGAHRSWHIAIR